MCSGKSLSLLLTIRQELALIRKCLKFTYGPWPPQVWLHWITNDRRNCLHGLENPMYQDDIRSSVLQKSCGFRGDGARKDVLRVAQVRPNPLGTRHTISVWRLSELSSFAFILGKSRLSTLSIQTWLALALSFAEDTQATRTQDARLKSRDALPARAFW